MSRPSHPSPRGNFFSWKKFSLDSAVAPQNHQHDSPKKDVPGCRDDSILDHEHQEGYKMASPNIELRILGGILITAFLDLSVTTYSLWSMHRLLSYISLYLVN
jgi:hypothetical protein